MRSSVLVNVEKTKVTVRQATLRWRGEGRATVCVGTGTTVVVTVVVVVAACPDAGKVSLRSARCENAGREREGWPVEGGQERENGVRG